MLFSMLSINISVGRSLNYFYLLQDMSESEFQELYQFSKTECTSNHGIISGPTIIEKNFGEQNWLVVSMDNSASMNMPINNPTEGVNAPNSLYAVEVCGERKIFFLQDLQL